MTPHPGGLARSKISASFGAEQTVLRLRGEVDVHTAPELGAFFEAALASGYSSIVLDLSDLEFVDAAALGVIVNAWHHLAGAGGQLAIRSPSVRVSRILEHSELAKVAGLGKAGLSLGQVGLERPLQPPMPAVRSGSDALTKQLSTLAALPAADDVVDGALRLVVALALATVGCADGVSVSLRRHGRLATVAASNQTVLDMDAGQYATGEGPCVDASIEGSGFHVESLNTETRWPAFIPRATALGINSILSSPLLAHDQPVGALNIYSRVAAAFAPKDQLVAAMLATEASIILSDAGVEVTNDQWANRLQQALRSRQIIDQAQGVIMERNGVSADDAYTLLRRLSLETTRPLLERAEDIVASTRQVQPNLGRGTLGAQGG